MIATVLFVLFSALAIFGAVMMITRKNPLISALFLVVTFFSIAALYFMLNAQLIAIFQIIVYAGAIMVLFIFVIMLLDLAHLPGISFRIVFTKFVGLILVFVLAWVIASVFINQFPGLSADSPLNLMAGEDFAPESSAPPAIADNNMKVFAWRLFTKWIYPFEIISVILLAAVVGAVLFSKREVR